MKKIKYSFTFLMLITCLLTSASDSHAQCPTNIAPTSEAWQGPLNVNITSGTCLVNISYCYRYYFNTTYNNWIYETIVTSNMTISGGPCDPDDVSTDIANYLESQVEINSHTLLTPCDPNNPTYAPTKYTARLPLCWSRTTSYDVNNQPIREYHICSNGFCLTTADICKDGNNIDIRNISYQAVGGSDCTANPGKANVVDGVCYSYNCGPRR